jgi:hypothetical protein
MFLKTKLWVEPTRQAVSEQVHCDLELNDNIYCEVWNFGTLRVHGQALMQWLLLLQGFLRNGAGRMTRESGTLIVISYPRVQRNGLGRHMLKLSLCTDI